MTTEEKAKAYDEALEKAKKFYNELAACRTKQKVAAIFPELADSEDERIRKELVALFIEVRNREGNEGYWHDLKVADILAYLEKQKYNRMQPVYDNQESFESALDKAWKEYNDSGSRTVDGCEDDYVECAHAKGFREGYLFGIEKQKEQKPMEHLDKDKVYPIMTKLMNLSCSQLIPINSDEYKKIHEIISDVRSLLDYPIEQNPADWSEEDEMYLSQAIETLEHENYLVLAEKLKSLRPQPHTVSIKDATKFGNLEYERGVKDGLNHHWKPSEEQMKALIDCTIGNEYDVHALVRLFAELKKL